MFQSIFGWLRAPTTSRLENRLERLDASLESAQATADALVARRRAAVRVLVLWGLPLVGVVYAALWAAGPFSGAMERFASVVVPPAVLGGVWCVNRPVWGGGVK